MDDGARKVTIFGQAWDEVFKKTKQLSDVKIDDKIEDYKRLVTKMQSSKQPIEEAAKSLEITDKQVIKAAKDYPDLTDGVKKFESQLKKSNNTVPLSTKAFNGLKMVLTSIGSALASAAISFAISKIIEAVIGLATSEKRLAEAAKEAGESLKQEFESIDDYKSRIDELHKVINDSSSSFEEVGQARTDLMKLQDELIDKYGIETDGVNIVTEAINEQSNALDRLAEAKYRAIISDYNSEKEWYEKAANWFKEKISDPISIGIDYFITGGEGTGVKEEIEAENKTTKLDEMVDKMRHNSFEIEVDAKTGALLEEASLGNWAGGKLRIYGNVYEIQEKLQKIQDISSKLNVNEDFNNAIETALNSTRQLIEENGELYNQYLLYDVIYKNDDYKDYYDKLLKAKSDYDAAVASGDNTAINLAISELGNIYDQIFENIKNDDVLTYFENLFPAIQKSVNEKQFDINFKANTDSLKTDISDSLSVLDGFSLEELLDANVKDMKLDEIRAYGNLQEIAEEYFNGNIEALLNYLNQEGMILTNAQEEFVKIVGEDFWNKLSEEDKRAALSSDSVRSEVKNYFKENSSREILKVLQAKYGNEDGLNMYNNLVTGYEGVTKHLTYEQQKSSEVINEFAEMTGMSVEEILNYLSNGENGFEGFFNNIIKDAKKAKDEVVDFAAEFKTVNDALQKLTDNANLLSNVTSEIEKNGYISASTLSSIAEKYSDMAQASYEYQLGLISEQELLAKLEECYEKEKDAYIESIKIQTEESETFMTNLMTNNQDFFKGISELYGIDLENWKTVAKAKLDIEKNLVTELQTLWGEGFSSLDSMGIRYNESTGKYEQISNYDDSWDSSVYNGADADEIYNNSQWKKTQDLVDKWNKLLIDVDEITLKNIPDKFDFSWGGLSSNNSSSSSTDTWKEEFNKQVGLLKHQLEMNVITQAQYYSALDKLNQKYFKDQEKYLEEYRQYEEEVYKGYLSLQDEAISNVEKLRDKRIEMIKYVKEQEIKAIEKTIEAEQEKLDKFKEEIDARKEALELAKDEEDHAKELSEKNKAISDIEIELENLKYDNSAKAQKKRRELEEELAEAKEDLADYITDYEYDKEMERLDKEAESAEDEFEKFEKEKNQEIELIREFLDDEKKLIKQAMNDINGFSETLFEEMKTWANETTGSIWEIVDAWKQAKESMETYNSANNVTGKLEELQNNKVEDIATGTAIDYTYGQITDHLHDGASNTGVDMTTSGSSGSNSSDLGNSNSGIKDTYTIKSGDSMWAIAEKFYPNDDIFESMDKLAKANGMSSIYDTIYPGQKFVIPFKTGGYTGNDEGLAYLHQKELVLNEEQTQPVLEALPKLANVLPNLQELIDMGSYLIQNSFKPFSPAFAGVQPQNIVSIGDININGNMGNLTKSDLNEFRKGIVNDVYESMQKNRTKAGRY